MVLLIVTRRGFNLTTQRLNCRFHTKNNKGVGSVGYLVCLVCLVCFGLFVCFVGVFCLSVCCLLCVCVFCVAVFEGVCILMCLLLS